MEPPNLLALLTALPQQSDANQTARISGLIEYLLSPLQQPQALALVVKTHQQAVSNISVWSQSQFASKHLDISRLLQQDDLQTAYHEVYQHSIKLSEKLDDMRGITIKNFQLANVRLYQKHYDAALAAYAEAREIFSQLNEPQSIFTIWHQTGMVYKTMQAFEQAENAYREALKIDSKLDNKAGEARSLGEIGNLYYAWRKPDEAVLIYRLALNIFIQLDDKGFVGVTRSNIASILIELHHYDEARSELQKAIQSYLAYPRDGGANIDKPELPQLCQEVLLAIHENQQIEWVYELSAFKDDVNLPDNLKHIIPLKPVIPKLIAILQGERNPALADDPELDYDDAAELLLLLEAL